MSDVIPAPKPIVPLGTSTVWGKISAVGLLSGERYYWMTKGRKVKEVAMMPAIIVEEMYGDIKNRRSSDVCSSDASTSQARIMAVSEDIVA